MFEQPLTGQSGPAFPATDWALIDEARLERGAGPAYERFCELYWYPVYAFIRRSWPLLAPEDVLEATQEYFTQRVEQHDLWCATQYDGQLRQWIMGGVSNLLRNRRKWEHAQKRDRRKLVWVDGVTAEARLRMEPKTLRDPLRLFERDLALGVLERSLVKLASEYASRDSAAFFERAVRMVIPGEGEAGYAELERRWGLSTDTLKVRMNTMRRRLARLVSRELGVPDGDAEAADAKLTWLFQAFELMESVPEPSPYSGAPADALPNVNPEGGSRWPSEGDSASDTV
jgi:hypothetical protein